MSDESKYYLYISRNSKNQFYIGISNNPQKRISRHNNLQGAKFTSLNPDFKLVYQEQFPDLLSAMRREKQLKGWTRVKKEALIEGNFELLKKL